MPKFYRYGEDLERATAAGRTLQHELVNKGLLPKPIKVGARSVGFPSDEIDSVMTLRLAGASDDQIRKHVQHLHAKRLEAGAALMAKVEQGTASASLQRVTQRAASQGREAVAQ